MLIYIIFTWMWEEAGIVCSLLLYLSISFDFPCTNRISDGAFHQFFFVLVIYFCYAVLSAEYPEKISTM